ncbi:flagellar hook-length control protein [Myxococcus landrumensis]|uniref:Flagellar hook-length control protein n=1 Tax=Myxococcus landrumensis TaxID=2813577 RepID=A0ABX7N5V2_9BACT|nr:flagellar hook-length control protein [Myxococcus landrumus]QSQ14115.1 flagellar hook-length control protein [Myxococcus landrumus]
MRQGFPGRVWTLWAVLAVAPAAEAKDGYAMTWQKRDHAQGVDLIGCVDCNPYTGDMPCSTALPILCIRQDGSAVPPGVSPDFYNGWAEGNVATTLPVLGGTLTSLAIANKLCTSALGDGWRMAQFHHPQGGWNWYAYGNVRTDKRFWVYIRDQPANCWNP